MLRLVEEASKVDEVNVQIHERNHILNELKENLSKAQNRMKKFVDVKRREVSLEVGNLVFVKLQPYRLRTLAKRPNEKLSPRYYGPYKVVERLGAVAYKLELPSYSKIHPVFHISQLKKLIGPAVQPQQLPTCLEENLELHVQPEQVLQTNIHQRGI